MVTRTDRQLPVPSLQDRDQDHGRDAALRRVGPVRTALGRFGKEVSFSLAASLALASANWWFPALSDAVAGPADEVSSGSIAEARVDTSTVILKNAVAKHVDVPAPLPVEIAKAALTDQTGSIAHRVMQAQDAAAQMAADSWSDDLPNAVAAVEAPTFADLAPLPGRIAPVRESQGMPAAHEALFEPLSHARDGGERPHRTSWTPDGPGGSVGRMTAAMTGFGAEHHAGEPPRAGRMR